MECLTGRLPPDGEVLLDRPTEVGAVRGRLRHQLMEDRARALPVRSLDGQEGGEENGGREAKHPAVGGRTNNRSHEWEGEQIPSEYMRDCLGTHFL